MGYTNQLTIFKAWKKTGPWISIYPITLAQYISTPNIPGYVYLPEYLILGKYNSNEICFIFLKNLGVKLVYLACWN
jgi:hypothetical protein